MGLLIADGRIATGNSWDDHFQTRLLPKAARYGLALPGLDELAPEAMPARVNHNRIIVDCPDCRGAEFVWTDRPILMCSNCFNAAAGNRWRPVLFVEDWAEIVSILSRRPMPASRNWSPGETLDDLRAENLEHGDPI